MVGVDFLIERMTRQGLSARRLDATAAVATTAVGLQAQDVAAARLGVRARSSAVDEVAVTAAYADEGSVVRTWLMRATVHLIAAEDVRWMTALFGPMIERRFRTARWPALGITDGVIDAAGAHVRSVLTGRQLTRHELAAALADRGITLADDPQAATHLVLALSARGLTCRASDRGRDATFALIDEWVIADPVDPVDPVAELARRYFHAFGPATAADFTAWSGLPSGPSLAAVRDELTEVAFDGRRGWTFGSVEPVAAVRLLPKFDNYLIGYRDRSAIVDGSRQRQVYVGGLISATVVCDGQVIGCWRLDRTAQGATVRVTPFRPFTRRHRRGLEQETADLERFLDRPVQLAVED
jgi:Winged helix DNA-binding domain